MTIIAVLLIGLVAGVVSGIVGFGGTIILLPILTLQFGPKAAVPIMAVAAILGNFARVMAWWHLIRWPAVGAYAAAAIPATWLGARTMLSLDPSTLELFLGVFFIAIIPARHWLAASGLKVSLWGLMAAGAIVGFLTGIVANTGPINTPFFLAHGLTKGAFIGTEAMSSLTMFTSKVTAFRSFGALDIDMIQNGLVVGASLMLGTFIGKRFLLSMNEQRFSGLMDGLLFISGGAMIWAALQA